MYFLKLFKELQFFISSGIYSTGYRGGLPLDFSSYNGWIQNLVCKKDAVFWIFLSLSQELSRFSL